MNGLYTALLSLTTYHPGGLLGRLVTFLFFFFGIIRNFWFIRSSISVRNQPGQTRYRTTGRVTSFAVNASRLKKWGICLKIQKLVGELLCVQQREFDKNWWSKTRSDDFIAWRPRYRCVPRDMCVCRIFRRGVDVRERRKKHVTWWWSGAAAAAAAP